MDRREREADELKWVADHGQVARVALRGFLAHGEWPAVAVVQRDLDRSGVDADVAGAIIALPAGPDEPRSWQPTTVTIPMRVLWHLPEARPVVQAAFELILRASAAYLSESDEPVVSGDDFINLRPDTQAMLGLGARLVMTDYPNPFRGGGWGESWRLQVNDSVARLLDGIATPEEYFDWQYEVLDRAAGERRGVGADRQRSADFEPLRFVNALRAAQIGHVSDRLVLLGAGSSVEAGLPDGRGLADALVQSSQLPLLRQILLAIGDPAYPDVERAFSVLEAIAELDQPASLLSDLRQLDLLRSPFAVDPVAARVELGVVRRELRRRLWLPDGLGVGVVSGLLGNEYSPPEEVAYLVPLASASVGGTVASLNYDNVLELAAGPVAVTSPAGRRVLVPDDSDRYLRLLKLHGSLSWQRIGDDVISGGRPLEREHYEPAVIFGALNKLRHYGPYLDLLRALSDSLASVHYVIVLGYGFRDPHINEALRVWASRPAPDVRQKMLIASLGAHTDRLPDSVAAWRVYEHLTVQLLQKDTSDAVKMLFG
jgi:hypothetical protein